MNKNIGFINCFASKILLLFVVSSPVSAAPMFHALFESDPGGLNNVNLVDYDSFTDLRNLTSSSTTSLNFASGVSMSGLTFDGSQFHALFESDPGGLNNVNLVSYDSFADLKALTASSSTSLNFASGVSMSGLTFDGSQFHALFESDPGGLNNVNLVSYDSFADLKALNSSSSTSLNFASGVSMSGLTFDGSQFHALFESDPGGLNNVNLVSYDSFADLKALNSSSSTSLNFASGVSMSGLASSSLTIAVPVPGSLVLIGLGLVGLGLVRRRKAT